MRLVFAFSPGYGRFAALASTLPLLLGACHHFEPYLASPAAALDAGVDSLDGGATDSAVADGKQDVASPADATVDAGRLRVRLLAGSPTGESGYRDGLGQDALFGRPNGIAVDGQGRVYVADQGDSRIRRIDSAGQVSTVAGSGLDGWVDGPAAGAQFFRPRGVAVDASGARVYVADSDNHRVRLIEGGSVSTVAGTGTAGWLDGPGSTARFNMPYGIAATAAGRLYVIDKEGQRVRAIDTNGAVSTVAGSGESGHVDGPALEASFSNPYHLAVDVGANLVYIADRNNDAIRSVDLVARTVTTLAGDTTGYLDGPASTARFSSPHGVAVDAQGRVYVADSDNAAIRLVANDGGGWQVSTLAGDGTPGFRDGDPLSARFDHPYGVAVGADGRIYVSETIGCRVRVIEPY